MYLFYSSSLISSNIWIWNIHTITNYLKKQHESNVHYDFPEWRAFEVSNFPWFWSFWAMAHLRVKKTFTRKLLTWSKRVIMIASSTPSVVQAYTQPYSFDGRIKLIICQISHELSVALVKRKTLDGGPYRTCYNSLIISLEEREK